MTIFKDWTTFEKYWLVTFTLINLYLFFAWDDSILGFISALSGMLCVVLVAKGKITNYYFGIVQTSTYAYIAYTYALYGEAMLNAFFYFPIQFIGIYLWRKNQTSSSIKGEDIRIKRMTRKGWVRLTLLVLVSIFLYALFLTNIGGKSVYIDSTTNVLSIVAQILMIRRFAEQWIFWIMVNIFSIILWLTSLWTTGGNEISMLVMWTAFLVNSIYGYINWTKLYRQQKEV
ncbi:nicotinamide mononucleotide transporter [Hazenella sp. IB182357]|uniref:Nicotinamide mononucleotide transporter n=1 Tax=Polycladospora coralii TaxID=2771432 RepID=A0A926NGC4_9BACL|nr:nicotinamide riboside transporter PnuC [Polycladospora coralii]MBD1372828.1 nicotinamide mononucleotide transporter [Polycladospora coralii]